MTDIIIQSKCMAPSPSTHCINRAALMKTLKKSHHHTCTFIHSGAGYGKTTILTQFLSNEANKFSWYSISEEDDNLLPFLRHLFLAYSELCRILVLHSMSGINCHASLKWRS